MEGIVFTSESPSRTDAGVDLIDAIAALHGIRGEVIVEICVISPSDTNTDRVRVELPEIGILGEEFVVPVRWREVLPNHREAGGSRRRHVLSSLCPTR